MLFEPNTLHFKYLAESFTQRTATARKNVAWQMHYNCYHEPQDPIKSANLGI